MKQDAEYYRTKYAGRENVKKLIILRHIADSDAVLEFWEKDTASHWQKIFDCAAIVGRNGMGKEREGDEKTPLGDFGLICAFGLKPDPGARLPYVQITEDIWCCGDGMAYNRIIDIKKLPHRCRGEKMADYYPEYNYGIFPDYNAEGKAGLGFAIFLHCRGEKNYTGGCIAVDEEHMIKLVCAADNNTRLCIL